MWHTKLKDLSSALKVKGSVKDHGAGNTMTKLSVLSSVHMGEFTLLPTSVPPQHTHILGKLSFLVFSMMEVTCPCQENNQT